MFWYLLQITVIVTLTHIYATKLTPDEPIFSITVFAIMVAYVLTAVLTLAIDLLRRAIWFTRRVLGLNPLIGQQRSSRPRIEVTKNILPKP